MNHILCFRWFPRKIILGITSSMCVSLCIPPPNFRVYFLISTKSDKRGDRKTTRLHKFPKTRKPGRKKRINKIQIIKKAQIKSSDLLGSPSQPRRHNPTGDHMPLTLWQTQLSPKQKKDPATFHNVLSPRGK